MEKLVKRIKRIIAKVQEKKLNFDVDKSVELERLGSDYGGWVIPTNFLDESSICYCVGAGLDITFDLALAQKYKCHVHILDPTPGAAAHFQALSENTQKGESTYTNRNVEKYSAEVDDLQYLNFFDVGLWNENTTLKFFVPQNKDHISHSALNLQGTDDFFEAKVNTLSTFMKQQNHDRIDLLKLDIEGAEYKVIENLLSENLPVGVICVEFDESLKTHLDKDYIERIQNTLDLLKDANYILIHAEKDNNYTLAKAEIIRQLKG